MNKRLVAIAAPLFCVIASTAHAEDYSHIYGDPHAQKVFVESKIHEHFPGQLGNTMVAIANCESRGLQQWLPNGQLRPQSQGKSSAAGTFQVLLHLHRKEIRHMGLDMQNIDDYLRFVRYLYKQQGFHPWDASRKCWQRRVARK